MGRKVLRGATLMPLDGRSALRRTDLLVDNGRIAAIGGVDASPEEVRGVIMPGLVQAHLHLDLSLQNEGFVPNPSPRVHLERQRAAWRRGLDDAALSCALRAGLAWSLGTGATTVVDPSSARHHSTADQPTLARLVCFVDATRKDVAEALVVVREALAARALEASPSLALWVGDAERTPASALRTASRVSEKEGLPLVAEVGARVGDRRGIDRLERAGALGPRTLVAHGHGHSLGGARGVQKLAAAGAKVVLTPSFEVLLGAPSAPAADLLDAGVSVGLGSECGAARLGFDLFSEARLALRLLDGHRAHPATDALLMATRHGADAVGVDAGSLEVGRSADLLLIGIEAEPGDDHESLARKLLESAGPEHIHRVWIAGRACAPPRAPSQDELQTARAPSLAAVRALDRGFERGEARARLARRIRRARGWHAGKWP